MTNSSFSTLFKHIEKSIYYSWSIPKQYPLQCLFFLLLLSCLLLWTGSLHTLYEYLMGPLFTNNQLFIENAQKRSESTLLLISEIYAGLMVLQSVEFSVSFFVEAAVTLGNSFAQATDLAAHGRNAALAGLIVINFFKGIHQAIYWIAPSLIILIEIAIIALAICHRYREPHKRWHQALHKIAESILLSSVFFLLVLPLSIKILKITTDEIMQSYHQKNYTQLQVAHSHINSITKLKVDVDDKQKTTHVISEFKKLHTNLSTKTNSLAKHIASYIALLIAEIIFLPLLLIGLLYMWLRSLLKYNFSRK